MCVSFAAFYGGWSGPWPSHFRVILFCDDLLFLLFNVETRNVSLNNIASLLNSLRQIRFRHHEDLN